MTLSEELRNKIQKTLDENEIVLFMKGTKHFPQCGFSATVIEALKLVEADFHSINVLEDPEIRQGIKEFANWPTIPQLYVKGRFVGGCDIIKELYHSGELKKLVS